MNPGLAERAVIEWRPEPREEEKERKDTGEMLSPTPPLSLPGGEKEREGSLSLLKMHRAQPPTVAWLLRRAPRAGLLGVLEHGDFKSMRDVDLHQTKNIHATVRLCSMSIYSLSTFTQPPLSPDVHL